MNGATKVLLAAAVAAVVLATVLHLLAPARIGPFHVTSETVDGPPLLVMIGLVSVALILLRGRRPSADAP
jgi:hypothetical protein